MFCSKKSTKKINAVHKRSFRIIQNDYESLYPLLLQKTHQITFHQRCINSLKIEVYKYLNGHSPDIMNDIFKLRENTSNLWNFHIFQTENPCSLKLGLHAVPYCDSQLWQQVPTDIRKAASLTLFTNRIKTGNVKIVHVDLAKYLFKMSVISDHNISINCSICMRHICI